MHFFKRTTAFLLLILATVVAAKFNLYDLEGSPGQFEKWRGQRIYIVKPEDVTKRSLFQRLTGSKVGLLLLSGARGIQLKDYRDVADQFASRGYVVAAPDMFGEEYAQPDRKLYGWDPQRFSNQFLPSVIDPVIVNTLQWFDSQTNVKEIVGAGYSFGARHIARYLHGKKYGLKAGFVAHPALLNPTECDNIEKPIYFAFAAQNDEWFVREAQEKILGIMLEGNVAFAASQYSGTRRHFAVATNETDEQVVFAKKNAFEQAVAFLSRFHAKLT
ncbi:hypothetical protein F66182_9855 [Fusarium sp. NRRL 66182]|nr:hypothetical protein F66182_9855 [Fusarium sp. NRRL 66182]